MNEWERYILEQAKIEIDHTRSWPTKALAFYVTTNFGLVGSLIGLRKTAHSLDLQCWVKVALILLICTLSAWAVAMLVRNHHNYLIYRNLQIRFQVLHSQELRNGYQLPPEWFEPNDVRPLSRFIGWGVYLCIVVIIWLLSTTGILFVI